VKIVTHDLAASKAKSIASHAAESSGLKVFKAFSIESPVPKETPSEVERIVAFESQYAISSHTSTPR